MKKMQKIEKDIENIKSECFLDAKTNHVTKIGWVIAALLLRNFIVPERCLIGVLANK